ncbi:MAG: biotin/lipoyl-binding protein, partial [Candidatus Azobacteroides sp.]|nr:biotin/lipoyl-binding protein [Candidatus Azobacteroides sp.]
MNKMHNKRSTLNFQLSTLFLCLLFSSCHSKPADAEGEEEEQQTVTPVTVTQCTVGDMQDKVELNATSTFLLKNQIKATTNGYIKSVSVLPGQRVTQGQVLFVLKGKEAENLGATINELDTTTHFTGEIKITANSDGFVTAINS